MAPMEYMDKSFSYGDVSVILPLRIIFNNILSTAIYPDIWKFANVTPVYKRGDN